MLIIFSTYVVVMTVTLCRVPKKLTRTVFCLFFVLQLGIVDAAMWKKTNEEAHE